MLNSVFLGVATVVLSACAATSNPDRSSIKPVASVPQESATPPKPAPTPATNGAPVPAPDVGAKTATASDAKPAEQQPVAPQTQDPKTPTKPEPAPANAAAATNAISVGQVGGQSIDVREFLSRLWTRDNRMAKEVLEQIAFARLALYESDRIGIALNPERVDEVVARTWASLAKKLTDAGSKLTVEEHIRENLDLDPTRYRQQLRTDAVVQLLAERCVRAWVLENERVVVRITEAKDDTTAGKIRAALDGGRSFADVALEFGAGDDQVTKTTSMVIVRSETQELSRLAFATPVGSVGGPLVQGGRFLFLSAEQRPPPETGPWSTLGPKIEADLGTHRVSDLEYVQWRAAMMRRYQVDFEPFLKIVGEKF